MPFRRAASLALLSLSCLLATTVQADSFRVISLSQIRGLTSLEFVSEGEVEQVPVSVSSFSQAFPIPQSRQLALYAEAPKPGEEAPAPLLNLQFPNSSHDQIVLLKAVQTPNGSAYRYEMIDDSDAAFPAGSVYICNYMKEPVLIRLGQKQVTVAPNQRSVVPLANREAPFNDGVAFAAEIDGHGRVFSTSSWYLVPSMKIFCIIYQDERGHPQIRRIRLT